ncbi:NepR family anti-sigma factor [Pseudoroseomonas globiformis]|uniref:NepR family anti-sigma factor n=1 Tax=Teichococcus globiformis TaxID=2307229 RepID=A0ABV7FXS7_9PROT
MAEQAMQASHPGSGRARKRTPDAAFDEWLQRGLHAMYDDVAQEPIPDELLRLIDQDRNRDQDP